MEEGLWYVRREGQVIGPLTGLDVRSGVAAGRMSHDVEVSKDKTTWRPASAVPGLVSAAVGSEAVAVAPPGVLEPAVGAAAAPLLTSAPVARPRAGSRFGPPPGSARVRRGPRRAEPMDRLPEPDAWSARWGTALAVVSLVAWILPVSTDMLGFRAGGGDGSRWIFPWSPEYAQGQSFALQLVQPGAAVAALVILRMLRGAGRGMALLAVTVGTVLASLFFQEGRGGLDLFTGPAAGGARAGGLIALALLAGGIGAAVGNHLRKRAPEAGPGRALCAAGGALVVLPFLIPVEGTPIIALFFQVQAWSVGWPLVLLLALTLTYGVTGVRHLSSSPDYEGRCVRMSRLGRALLVAPPLAATIFMIILSSKTRMGEGPSFLGFLLLMGKGWGSFVGIFALVGVGLAAWFEDGIYRRMPKPVDARAAAAVFR